jgi:hypothetical protein
MLPIPFGLKHLPKRVPSFDELVNHFRVCWIKYKRNSCERVDARVEEELVNKTSTKAVKVVLPTTVSTSCLIVLANLP